MGVVGNRRGDGAALKAETVDEGAADVAVDPVPRNDSDLGDVGGRVRDPDVAPRRYRHRSVLGDDQTRLDADDRQVRRAAGNLEIGGRHPLRLHAVEADRFDRRPCLEDRGLDDPTGGDHGANRAGGEIVDQHEIGAPSRSDDATVAEPEGPGGRPACRAVHMMEWPAQRDQRPDHVIEMALLGDVERITIVCTEAHEAGGVLVEDLGQRMHVL